MTSDEPVGVQDDQLRESVVSRLLQENFGSWLREQRQRENLQKGRAQFNEPSSIPDPEQHNPSKLLQCHRKTVYRQSNAPAENPQPHGYFFFGTQVEQELILEFLQDALGDVAYVSESMFIDVDVEIGETTLNFRGSTDPVIVDSDGTPLVPTEIKTTTSIANRDSPNNRHLAQVHVYLHGLSESHNVDLTDAVLLYIDRETLELKAFHIEFDDNFWNEHILSWAANHTEYRIGGELPPAVPHSHWECDYCPFSKRCGRADNTEYKNVGPVGFLPLVEYPREQVKEHVEAHDGVRLTPLLAHQFEKLADEHGAYDWQCPACSASYAQDEVSWDGNPEQPPLCPSCLGSEEGGVPAPLRGPPPADQRESNGGGD